MKKFSFFICSVAVFGISCSSPATATPVPVAILEPTSTPSLSDVPSFEDGITILVTANDFSMEVPFQLLSKVDENGINITDEQDNFFIRFSIDPNEDNASLDVLLDQYFAALEKKGASFSKKPGYKFNLNDLPGRRVDFSGTVQDIPVEGSAIAVPSNKAFIFIGFGLSELQQDKDAWKNKGLSNFDKLANSVTFLDGNAECPISTDETYGYIPENPIKVGGGDFSGPSRERAYLDHLLDAKGNVITYDRTGSTMVDSVILDIYVISTSSGDITLYVDEYNYTPLEAPVDFTCQGNFPLSAP